MMKRFVQISPMLFLALFSNAQIPKGYWQFDAFDPDNDTTVNNHVLSGFTQPVNVGAIQINGGIVGDFMLMDSVFAQIETQDSINKKQTATAGDSSSFSIEFLLKLNDTFAMSQPVTWGGKFMFRLTDHFIFAQILLAGKNQFREFQINLDGVGRKDFGYYMDKKWHHFAVTYETCSGDIAVYVDGICPDGFSKEMKTSGPIAIGSRLYFVPSPATLKHRGGIDEIAVYDTFLTAKIVYNHYSDAIVNNNHYQFLNPSDPAVDTIKLPTAITEPENDFNPLDYAEGYPQIPLTPETLLRTYPGARYLPNHGLPEIYPFFGDWHKIQESTNYRSGRRMQREMVRHFNYMLSLGDEGAYRDASFSSDTTTMGYHFSNLALEPGLDRLRRFLRTDWEFNKTYGSNCYGQYIGYPKLPGLIYLHRNDLDGCDTVSPLYISTDMPGYPKYKEKGILGPISPLDSIRRDGGVVRNALVNLYAWLNLQSGNKKAFVNAISENGEAFKTSWFNAMQYDSKIVAHKTAAGISSWDDYDATRKRIMARAYADVFVDYADSSNSLSPVFNNEFFGDSLELQWYDVGGTPPWIADYDSFKTVQKTNSVYKRSSQYYYPQKPFQWRFAPGWTNGAHRFSQSRQVELAAGDTLTHAFISPGFFTNEVYANHGDDEIIRPGQWLALTKHLGCLGADTYSNFMYFGFNGTPPDVIWDGNWRTWKIVIPSYAQAIVSRAKDLLYNGDLLPGSGPGFPSLPVTYEFQTTGSYLDYVTVRQSDLNSEQFLIVGSRQKLSNSTSHGLTEKSTGIKLNGDSLIFNIRTQGSVYLYDKSKPTFIQLDGWHENKEPSRWCEDFEVEAENYNSISNKIKTITATPVGASAGDFSVFTTYLSKKGPNPPGVIQYSTYSILVRKESQDTLYPWILARHSNPIQASDTIGFTLAATGTNWPPDTMFQAVSDSGWTWYRLIDANGDPLALKGLVVGSELPFKIYSYLPYADIDKILFLRSGDSIFADTNYTNFTLSDTIVCPGDTIEFVNQSSVWGSCYELLWEFGDGTRSYDEVAYHLWENPGKYLVKLSVTDSCGERTSWDTITVTVNGPYVDAGEPQHVCGDSIINLNATVVATSFNWLTDSLLSSTSIEDPYIDSLNSTHTFYLAASADGCNDTDEVEITIVKPETRDTTIWLCNPADTVHIVLDGAFYFDWWSLDNPAYLYPNPNSPYPYAVPGIAGIDSFRVKVTDACKCDTDTVTVTIIAGVDVIITPDTIACPYVQIQLEARVDTFENIKWVPGTALDGASLWNPVVAHRDSLMYYVFFTDALDSVCYDSVNVDRRRPPIVKPGDHNTVCHGDVITLTVQPGFDSLLWIPGHKVSDSTNDTTSITIWADNFVVLASQDNFGCEHKQKINFEIGDTCCWWPGTDSAWVLNGKTASYLIDSLNGGSSYVKHELISISGVFVVDTFIYFDLDSIYLGPNAKIIVPNGQELKVLRSMVSSCKDTMWDCIFLADTGSIFDFHNNNDDIIYGFPGGRIEGAKKALYSPGVPEVNVAENRFINNHIGIQFGQGKVNGVYIAFNDFFSDASTMKFPHENQLGAAGVKFANVDSISYAITNNRFYDLDSGIVFQNSSGIINDNNFENVSIGIYSANDTLKIFDSDFNKVGIGIVANHSRVWADSNHFDSLHIGIHAYDSSYVSVTRNTFTNIRKYSNQFSQSGSAIKGNDFSTPTPGLGDVGTTLFIGDSSFYVPGIPSSVSDYGNFFENCDYGIRAKENVTVNSHHNRYDTIAKVAIQIDNTHYQSIAIHDDTIHESTTAIGIGMAENSIVMINDNTIYADTSSNRTGIRLMGGSNVPAVAGSLTVKTNDIRLRGIGILASFVWGVNIDSNLIRLYPRINNANDRGIKVDASDQSVIRNNRITSVVSYPEPNTIGVQMTQCEDALVSCNDVIYFHDGFLIHANCFNSEIWDNDITKAKFGMHFLNSAWIGIQGASLSPVNNRWLQFVTDSTLEIMTIADNTNGNMNQSWVQSDSLSYPDHFAYFLNPKNKSTFSQQLTDYDTTNNHRLDDCPNELQNLDHSGTGGASFLTEMLARDTTDFDYWTVEMPHYRDLYLYELLTLDDMLRFSDTLYEYLYDELEETNIKNLYDAQTAIEEGDLDAAEEANEFVPDNNLESNFQFSLSILIDVLRNGINSVSQADSSILDSIGRLCPVAGGYGVYVSRGILTALNPELQFQEDCFDSSSSKRNTINQPGAGAEFLSTMVIYPNPANDYFIAGINSNGGYLEIFSLDSRTIYRNAIPVGIVSYRFETPEWTKGIYIVHFRDFSGQIIAKKLVVF